MMGTTDDWLRLYGIVAVLLIGGFVLLVILVLFLARALLRPKDTGGQKDRYGIKGSMDRGED